MECRTESAPYGPTRVDPGVLPFITEFSASVMLGEQTAQEDMVEMDMRSPQAAATFDARAKPPFHDQSTCLYKTH